jgi:hypothetical protein
MDDGHLNLIKTKLEIPEVEVIFRPRTLEKKSCSETSKILGLYWQLYSRDDQQMIEQHLLDCSFCQSEFNQQKIKQERLKKEIPEFLIGNDLRQSLDAELIEVVKNTFNHSATNKRVNQTKLISKWDSLVKSAPKFALGVLGFSLLTMILMIPWI